MVCKPSFPDFSAFFQLLFGNKPATAPHSNRTSRNKALRLYSLFSWRKIRTSDERLRRRLAENLTSL